MRGLAALGALVLSGCSNGGGVVLVVVGSSGRVPAIASFSLTLSNAGATSATALIPIVDGPVDIPPSRTFSLSLPPERSGAIVIVIDAMGSDGKLIARGSGRGTVTPGQQTTAAVTLTGVTVEPMDDGGRAPVDAQADLSLGSDLPLDDGAMVPRDAVAPLDATAATVNPTVIATRPAEGATRVSVATTPTATFDQPMDPTTITALTFTLTQGTAMVPGKVVFDVTSNTASFAPDAPLSPGMPCRATITTGARDLDRKSLLADHTWTFTTGACSQAPVALGSAVTFAVLAATTITNTGRTTITGDLGLSPGTSVTGAPTVIGAQHLTDMVAAKAIADLSTAYSDAAGRTLCAIPLAGDIGGQTLTPGLYQSVSSLAIASGDLTLDAQGDRDAVFIIQTKTSLTTAAGYRVLLTQGARAANVYWQVGTAPSFAAMSAFKGTLLAHDAVSLGAGATLDEGRAMSVTAAVNLDTNTIVKPAP